MTINDKLNHCNLTSEKECNCGNNSMFSVREIKF